MKLVIPFHFHLTYKGKSKTRGNFIISSEKNYHPTPWLST